MDEKDDKKKESIDDILSDLNGLLNRMPSILDGIKMPPLEPVEFENPANGPKAETLSASGGRGPVAPSAAETRVIAKPGVEGQARGADSPAQEQNSQAKSGTVGESQKPTLKPRSDNLDSEKKHIGFPAPVNLAALPEQKTAKDEISGSAPLTAAPLFGDLGARDIREELSALSGTSGDAEAGNQAVLHTETGFAELSCETLLPPAENEKALPGDSLLSGTPTQGAGREAGPDHVKPRSYESTVDLGIPDIDVLFKISQGETAETLSASGGRGGTPSGGFAAGDTAQRFPLPVAPSAAEPVVPDASLAANAAKSDAAPPPDTGLAPLKAAFSGAENLEQELEKLTISDVIQSSGGVETATAVSPQLLGKGVSKAVGPQNGQTAAGGGEAVADTEAAPAGGLVLEQPGAVFSKEKSPEGDKTLLIAPSADGAGDEHAVIYQPGQDTASRRPKGADLGALSQKQPPEGVTEERIRSLAFLYPEGEEWFCAEVLSELDAICLKSLSKPIFVRRAFVKVFELNTNPNFMFQAVSDAKAAGLIFAGTLPQDKVYELESVFSSSGGLFRHLTADSFNHSSALDLVSELILR